MPKCDLKHYYNCARATGPGETSISKQSSDPAWKFLLPIFGVWLVLYGSYALSRPPLPDGPATMHAEIAREMLRRDDWKTAYVNGAPAAFSSKPLDWSIATSYKIFGVSDFSARLPIALVVLALAFTVYFLGRNLFVWNAAGLYAALIVLTWPGTFLATRDLSDAPFLYLGTAILALAFWRLVALSELSVLKAIAVSAAGIGLIYLFGRWPGISLPLSIVLICWICRRLVAPDEKRRRLLVGWLGLAWLISVTWIHPYQPSRGSLLWLATIAPLGLIAGGWLADKEAFANQAVARRIGRYLFVAGLFVSAVAVFFAIHGPAGFNLDKTSWVITASSSRAPLLVAALAIVVGASGNLIYRLQGRARIANCFLLGIFGGIIVAIQVGQVINSPYSSSQILAEAIRPELNPGDIVAIDGKYADASSLAFYLDHPVLTTDSAGGPKAPAFNDAWNSSVRVFIWTRSDRSYAAPGSSNVIARNGGKEILSNQPNAGGASF